ncbi:MAG: 8-hydroxy-5-deazaflavin:NADPH oxidoreductase [Actinomycetota bacterium]|jgi:predicted dinucleotide-binding enzyme|nr:8-hydroxy-5-deazaflavin:NADPH oxidoreductase [Actinomycetota bacterium]
MDEPIGIIGAGRLGQALARTARRADRPVVIANSRGPESLTSVVDALGAGITAGTTHDAARCAIVALAVPWASIHDALAELSWSGEIVIDATNAVLIPSLELVPLGGLTSSEIVAQLLPGARLVKAANTFAADVLGADPREAGGRRVMFVSGDDAEAKSAVGELFDATGFFPIDIGDLATGGAMQQAGGPLAGHNLVRMPAPWE